MKNIDNIIHNIESLNEKIKKDPSSNIVYDINSPGWSEKLAEETAKRYSRFAKEINNLNDELVLDWRQYSKQDILKLQDALGKARKAASYVGIKIKNLSKDNLIDALFLLLLQSKHDPDYRDCLLILNDILRFARENKVNYKTDGRYMSTLFDDYVFHTYFDKAML